MYCPVCYKRLSNKEALVLSNDTHGDIVVRHMVPKDFPIQTDTDRLGSLEELLEDYDDFYPDAPMRSYCGLAGFKVALTK